MLFALVLAAVRLSMQHGSDRPGTSRHCAQSRSVVLGLYHKFLDGLAGLFSAAPAAPLPCLPAHTSSAAAWGQQGCSSTTAPQSPPGSRDFVVLGPRAAWAQHTEKRTGAPCQRAGWENGGNGSELAARILVSTPLFWAVSTIAK